MLWTSEFDGGLPVGTVMQFAGLGPDAPLWRELAGQVLSRTPVENAMLEKLFPIGKMTAVIRTLAAVPSGSGFAISTGAHFVVAAATGTAALQYSADGATGWATVATQASTPVSAVATATRIVVLSSGAQAAMVSANLNPSSAWAATTGGYSSYPTTPSISRLCYVPGSPGKVVAVHQTSGIATLDDGSTAWVPRTSSARSGAAWSGQRVVGITASSAVISLSTDAITYVDALLPEAISANAGHIASDGDGIVVITGVPSGILVSSDHGLTFQFAQIPGIAASDLWRVQFSGGYFFIPTASGLAVSLDGRKWFLETTMVQPLNVATGVAKKGGTILLTNAGTTVAYTMTESATDFLLPTTNLRTPANSGNPIAMHPSYVKAL